VPLLYAFLVCCCLDLFYLYFQYDKDHSRLCILLKCRTVEGLVNVYRYLRAHEHKSSNGRMLDDSDIVQCLNETIINHCQSFNQTMISNLSMNLTLPTLTPPSPIRLTNEQMKTKREEITKIFNDTISM